MEQLESELAKPLTHNQLKDMVRQRQNVVNELVSKNRRIVDLVRSERDTQKLQFEEEKKRLEAHYLTQFKEIKRKFQLEEERNLSRPTTRTQELESRIKELEEQKKELEEKQASVKEESTKSETIRDMEERVRAAEERAHVGEERAHVAEERAHVAEERAHVAEEHAHEAEERAHVAEERAHEAEEECTRMAEEDHARIAEEDSARIAEEERIRIADERVRLAEDRALASDRLLQLEVQKVLEITTRFKKIAQVSKMLKDQNIELQKLNAEGNAATASITRAKDALRKAQSELVSSKEKIDKLTSDLNRVKATEVETKERVGELEEITARLQEELDNKNLMEQTKVNSEKALIDAERDISKLKALLSQAKKEVKETLERKEALEEQFREIQVELGTKKK